MKNKLHIKVGDKVKVISGDQKGYIGIIKTILSNGEIRHVHNNHNIIQ